MTTFDSKTNIPLDSYFHSKKDYYSQWKESVKNPDKFWGNGDIAWFLNGKLNICYNCVDRWANIKPDSIAIIWEGNEINMIERITYKKLQEEVCKMANVLKRFSVKKGDFVVIYMPMIPQIAYAMLACARIGAPYCIVYDSYCLKSIIECINSKYIITGNESIDLVDKTVLHTKIKKVFVCISTNNKFELNNNYCNLQLEMNKERPYCSCEIMDSEDILFLFHKWLDKMNLYVYTNGGYFAWAMATHRYVFDVQPGDIFAHITTFFWERDHNYIIYGPLSNGNTTFMFRSSYSNSSKFWNMIQRHKITHLNIHSGAIKTLMRYDNKHILKYDKSSLKLLGLFGNPIKKETWLWYFEKIGNSKCPIVQIHLDTLAGGITFTSLPSYSKLNCTGYMLPFLGIEPVLLEMDNLPEKIDLKSSMFGYHLYKTNQVIISYFVRKCKLISVTPIDLINLIISYLEHLGYNNNQTGLLVINKSWPGMARTLYRAHENYLDFWMKQYSGYYDTHKAATRDKNGYYCITHIINYIFNISGHTATAQEIENVIITHDSIDKVVVVGIPHETKGECLFVYAITKQGVTKDKNLKKSVKNIVRSNIGPFCKPDYVMFVDCLPKNKNGTIIRRILRKIAEKKYESIGNISHISNPKCVQKLINLSNNLV